MLKMGSQSVEGELQEKVTGQDEGRDRLLYTYGHGIMSFPFVLACLLSKAEAMSSSEQKGRQRVKKVEEVYNNQMFNMVEI